MSTEIGMWFLVSKTRDSSVFPLAWVKEGGRVGYGHCSKLSFCLFKPAEVFVHDIWICQPKVRPKGKRESTGPQIASLYFVCWFPQSLLFSHTQKYGFLTAFKSSCSKISSLLIVLSVYSFLLSNLSKYGCSIGKNQLNGLLLFFPFYLFKSWFKKPFVTIQIVTM